MFYEMILFCSLAGVVGAIISLAEINTEKARNFTGKKRGVPAAGVPHCHLVAPALGSQNRWGSAGSPCLPLAWCLSLGTLPERGAQFPFSALQRSLTTANPLGL